jgi:protein-S-isoprenylcysteine O-methyltransferase Ste14
MKRVAALLYGTLAYFAFFGTLVYFIGFVGNLTPVGIDSPREGPLANALLINLGLVALFGIQHSIMARKRFKAWITQYISPAIERSTFVLVATGLLALMIWQWQPIGGAIWDVEAPAARAALYALYGIGWTLLLAGSFVINHFDLFGLRQVWLEFRGKPYTPIRFRNPWLYRQVRHPLYLGFILGLWAAPTMTVTHLVLAAGLTAYILVGIRFEEQDLVAAHPEYSCRRRTGTRRSGPVAHPWHGAAPALRRARPARRVGSPRPPARSRATRVRRPNRASRPGAGGRS